MRTHSFFGLLVGLFFALSLSGCGQVVEDPGKEPTGPNPPVKNPPQQAKSAICPSATIDDAKAVALWTTRDQDLVFVRHDASERVAHHFTPAFDNGQVTIQKSGTRILVLVTETWQAQRSELVLFDRFGAEVDSLLVDRALDGAFIGDDGTIIVGATSSDGVPETLRWNDGALVEVAHGWTPLGASSKGFFAMRAGWEGTDPYGFLDMATNTIVPFASEGTGFYMVNGELVTIDDQKETVVIHSPQGTTLVPLAAFHDALGSDPTILQTRDEGWISVGSQPEFDGSSQRNIVVINVKTGESRLVVGPPDPINLLPMYCDSARSGYIASDGSLLFSEIDSEGLHVVRFPINGGPVEPVGKPLTQIALVNVGERAGGFVVLGSDGTDTYCGSPAQWPLPASSDAQPGNSVFAGRIGHADLLRKLEFGSTWAEHAIDPTGSCVLGAKLDPASSTSTLYRIDDLASGTSVEVTTSNRAAAWIE